MRTAVSKVLSLLLVVAVLGLILVPAEARSAPPPGFSDDFSSPTLDSAWQVYEYTGSRVYGFTGPANHYSMTDSSGRLRYYLDPMTHPDGFLNGYQRTYRVHSSYDHDPGLEISRQFSGDHWLFETKGEFYLPYTNGRYFSPRVYLGDGGEGTYVVGFSVGRDVNWRGMYAYLGHKATADFSSLSYPEQIAIEDSQSGPDTITYYFQIERAGGLLTTRWSRDGVNWTSAFTHDLGAAIAGLDQRATLAGLSWFNPANSYVDYDYVRVTPTNTPPDCAAAGPSNSALWPPNHQFVPIAVQGITDADGDPVAVTITAIRQDEPVNSAGDGDSAPDGKGIGTASADLRAERAAGTKKLPANGRVYHVNFAGDDGRGGTCSGEVLVGVPLNMGKTPMFIDDGALYDSTEAAIVSAAADESAGAAGERKLFLPSVSN